MTGQEAFQGVTEFRSTQCHFKFVLILKLSFGSSVFQDTTQLSPLTGCAVKTLSWTRWPGGRVCIIYLHPLSPSQINRATDISLKNKANGSITWKTNYTCVSMRLSLSKHTQTRISLFTFHTSSLPKINHRSQLMSLIMASCDCPFIIPLIISIIIIIISSLQFITPCPKEDGIMFRIAIFFFLFCFFSYFPADGKVHKPILQSRHYPKKTGRVLRCFM